MRTEAELQAAVIDLAHVTGWRAVHWRPALTSRGWRVAVQGDGAGWPDLTFSREGRLIFAELKRDGLHLTAPQRSWLDLLATVPGVECFAWTPRDWHDGTIARALGARLAAEPQLVDGHTEDAGEGAPHPQPGLRDVTLPRGDRGDVHTDRLREFFLGDRLADPKRPDRLATGHGAIVAPGGC